MVALVAVALFGVVTVKAALDRILASDDPVPYLLESGARDPSIVFTPLTGHVSPAELMSGAEVVFVGTVVSEASTADARRQSSIVRPVDLTVERVLRGEETPALQLLLPAIWDNDQDGFQPGDRLLVFAVNRTFGAKQITGLTAHGYPMGIFAFESENVVRNGGGVRMSVPWLAAELDRVGAGPRPLELAALPPGVPRVLGLFDMSYPQLDELVATSPAVFVGTVEDVGGPETVGVPVPGEPRIPPQSIHRVRFSVERSLRGQHVPTLDLSTLDGGPEVDPFVVGQRVLVFARFVTFGDRRITRLAPNGYTHGVFRVGGDGMWRNRAGLTTFGLAELERRLARTP